MIKIVLFALVCFTTASFAQTPQDLVQKFFKTFESDPGKAVIELHQTNPHNKERADMVINTKNMIASISETAGTFHGAELVKSDQFGKSVENSTYLVKYDKIPLIFGFVFYKPKDKWMLLSFNIDNSIAESGKGNHGNHDKE